jgi:hypothetical protein
MSGEDSDFENRLFALEQKVGTKQLPIPVSHAVHELRLMYGELKRKVDGFNPQGDNDLSGKPVPRLDYGQVYKASKVNETEIYIVFLGRDGNTAVKSFPGGKYFRPKDLTWDNLELAGTIEDILNP